MLSGITIEPLCKHPEALPALVQWFEAEWPNWYGSGGRGDAAKDLQSYAAPDGMPRAVVALSGGTVCGIAALKVESIPSHAHLTPWAAAALVEPSRRRGGIGAKLVDALEREAKALGYHHIYCGTSTARTLLRRCGWDLLEEISHDGEALGVYSKAL
jgi:GNAT superfamily N-acetyltransferase